MKINNYQNFLLEWGYGGEGGVASKDPIKVKSSMFTTIDLEDDDEDDDDEDIPILQDGVNENVNDIDPYGEENWKGKELHYSKWDKDLYSFLLQLEDEDISNMLYDMEGVTPDESQQYIDGIIFVLKQMGIDGEELKPILDDMNSLRECCKGGEIDVDDDYDDDEEFDPDASYEEWRDRRAGY